MRGRPPLCPWYLAHALRIASGAAVRIAATCSGTVSLFRVMKSLWVFGAPHRHRRITNSSGGACLMQALMAGWAAIFVGVWARCAAVFVHSSIADAAP